MKQGLFTVQEQQALTKDIYLLKLAGDTSAQQTPGQFVQISVPGFFLRRPFSVADWDAESLTVIYRIVGQGTARLTQCGCRSQLDLLTGLGNGFDTAAAGDRPLLIGGGAGVAPLYGLARRLLEAGKTVVVILGFNTAQDVYFSNKFRALGAEVLLSTMDGSLGIAGTVVDALAQLRSHYSYFYACGPQPMLRAVAKVTGDAPGEMSLEARMGCGWGACMGCTVPTVAGWQRVCKDGPVLKKEELVW